MTTNLQTSPYLPRQQSFVSDTNEELSLIIDKAYIDIASRVNERIIGIFAINYPIVTGETWYLQGQPRKQQTLRQVYSFSGPGPVINIDHGIKTSLISGFTKIYGTFTNGTNWYPLPYVTSTASSLDQVSVIVTPTQIVITGGGGVGQPVITSGWCILEWLSVVDTNS